MIYLYYTKKSKDFKWFFGYRQIFYFFIDIWQKEVYNFYRVQN